MGDVNKLFFEKKLAYIYGNYGNQQVESLLKMGANIGYIIPKEGALAWLDCWAILKKSKRKDLAHKWINFSLSKKMSLNLTLKHGLPNTLLEGDKFNSSDRIVWLRPINNPEKRKMIWDQILSNTYR